jgi:hypothetical protein
VAPRRKAKSSTLRVATAGAEGSAVRRIARRTVSRLGASVPPAPLASWRRRRLPALPPSKNPTNATRCARRRVCQAEGAPRGGRHHARESLSEDSARTVWLVTEEAAYLELEAYCDLEPGQIRHLTQVTRVYPRRPNATHGAGCAAGVGPDDYPDAGGAGRQSHQLHLRGIWRQRWRRHLPPPPLTRWKTPYLMRS